LLAPFGRLTWLCLTVINGGMETRFTTLVGCRYPLQQATMGGVATPDLAGAVARAGALGMLAEYAEEPAAERMTSALNLAGSQGAVGMGFFGHWIEGDLDTFEMAAARLRVVEIFWSDPDPQLIQRANGAGNALVAWQVGSPEHAVLAEEAGCDFVIAQGVEAGGHVRGTVSRMRLLEEVLDVVTIPVVLAGGIATAADVKAAIDGGAAAARVGTRFVATEESSAHHAYVEALIGAQSGADTVLTTAFSGGWPDAPHRVLKSAVEAATAFDGGTVGHARVNGEDQPIARFQASTPGTNVSGHVEAMALYAGEGVGAVRAVTPASDVVAELVAEIDPGAGS
jgi:NAD(P)H-dependent flavin oxidoreductase YrpB (nitropropane dioxygenase family)